MKVDKYIHISLDYAERCFCVYNYHFFNNSLPLPEFKETKSKSSLAYFTTIAQKKEDGQTYYYPVIVVSTSFNLPDTDWQDIIIHEMIHYYLWYFDKRDKTPHGPNFRAMMNAINDAFDRKLSVSYRMP